MFEFQDDCALSKEGSCFTSGRQSATFMQVVDSAVLKFPKAVTHFSPGSHAYMPEQTTSFPNVFIAGDWVKNIDHGANGLSQVKPPGILTVLKKQQSFLPRDCILFVMGMEFGSIPETFLNSKGSNLAGFLAFRGRRMPTFADCTRDISEFQKQKAGIGIAGSYMTSHLQERAYVTGLRAANFVVDHLNYGDKASILPVRSS